MKNRLILYVGNLLTAATAFWTGAAMSAPSATPAPAPATHNKPVPQSVYVVPEKDGRDPFFPNSERHTAHVVVVHTNPNAPSITLKLGGFSPGLAIINGHTLAPGEESDIRTPNGRVHVRLIEIREKDKAVTVEVDGEKRELTMAAGN
jgi:hypothetical protein